jgi:ABC-type transporter Mla maintaining outer membrane lipid asymmetry ATPase subunit MlaF
MREFHVIFMYYAYSLFRNFAVHLKATKKEEIIGGSRSGKAVLTTMKWLLRGLHLTKGFTSDVCINIE